MLEELRRLTAPDLRSEITQRREDQWFERKGPRVAAKDIAEAMIGFANAEGGLIVIGAGNGTVEGLSAAPAGRENDWRQAALDHTEPPVQHRIDYLTCVNAGGPHGFWSLVQSK